MWYHSKNYIHYSDGCITFVCLPIILPIDYLLYDCNVFQSSGFILRSRYLLYPSMVETNIRNNEQSYQCTNIFFPIQCMWFVREITQIYSIDLLIFDVEWSFLLNVLSTDRTWNLQIWELWQYICKKIYNIYLLFILCIYLFCLPVCYQNTIWWNIIIFNI